MYFSYQSVILLLRSICSEQVVAEKNGRPDLALIPDGEEDPVIIIEAKVRKKFSEMAEGCRAALDQI